VFFKRVGMHMGTNCAQLLSGLFVYSYEADFIQEFLQKNEKNLARFFNIFENWLVTYSIEQNQMLYLRHVVHVFTIEESMISSMSIPHHIALFLLSHPHKPLQSWSICIQTITFDAFNKHWRKGRINLARQISWKYNVIA